MTKSDVWFSVAVVLFILMFAVDVEKLVDCVHERRPMSFLSRKLYSRDILNCGLMWD